MNRGILCLLTGIGVICSGCLTTSSIKAKLIEYGCEKVVECIFDNEDENSEDQPVKTEQVQEVE